MEYLILQSESKDDLKLILKLAKKLGIEAAYLSKQAMDEIAVVNAMKKGKTGEYIDAKKFIKDLRM